MITSFTSSINKINLTTLESKSEFAESLDKTFEIINKLVAKDKNDVYYDWDRMNADVGSYNYFWEWWYSYDKNNIYLTSIVIDWVAPNSIQEVNWKLYFTRFWELEEAWEIFSEKFLKPNPTKIFFDTIKWWLN